MPWKILSNSSKCPSGSPFAVVKKADGALEGCHETREQAEAQLRALYASEPVDASEDAEFDIALGESLARDTGLRNYWVRGKGAVKIRWNTPGDFERCVKHLRKYVTRPDGLCAEYHHEATGKWPGRHPGKPTESIDDLRTFAAGDCPPGQHEMPDGTCMSDSEMPSDAYQDENSMSLDTTAATEQAWQGVLVVENAETGDGRMFASNSLSWPQLPIPLMYQRVTSHGGQTDESVNVGRIDEIWRDGNQIKARGVLDMTDPNGREAARKIKDRYLRGVSIDADSVKDSDVEYVFPEVSEDATEEELLSSLFATPTLTIFHSARIRATTLVNVPALVEASIDLVEAPLTAAAAADAAADADEECVPCSQRPRIEVLDIDAELPREPQPLVAAGHTITIADLPPAEWFNEPDSLPPIGAVWVTDDGQFFGLIGPSGVAHRAFKGRRVEIPMGKVDYTRWMNRPTIVRGGDRVATGVITMNCGHESPYASVDAYERMKHYDNSCSIAAVATVGESAKLKAPWVAGSLMPMSGTDFQRFMGCQLSGDWGLHRERPGWQELAAVLAVPVPAFARSTQTARVRVENGVIVASAVPIRHISELPKQRATNFRHQLEEIKLRVTQSTAADNRRKLAAIKSRLHTPTP